MAPGYSSIGGVNPGQTSSAGISPHCLIDTALTPLSTIAITELVILTIREPLRACPPKDNVVAHFLAAVITLIGTLVTVATSRSTIAFAPLLASLAFFRQSTSIQYRDRDDGEDLPRRAGPRWRPDTR